jgi:hypothetical protein
VAPSAVAQEGGGQPGQGAGQAAGAARYPQGATVVGPDETVVRVWAPEAKKMTVHYRRPGAPASQAQTVAMEAVGGGYWQATVPSGHGTTYKLQVNDHKLIPDVNAWQQERPFDPDGWSVAADPDYQIGPALAGQPPQPVDRSAEATWRGVTDEDFRERMFVEINISTQTRAGTFDALIPMLDALEAMGVGGVQFMPLHLVPGRGWAYDGSPFTLEEAFGGWDGLRRFIAEAHRRGIAVGIDIVFNHLPQDGSVHFTDLAGRAVLTPEETPWGRGLDMTKPEVREMAEEFILRLAKAGVDFFRFDAPHFIWPMKDSPDTPYPLKAIAHRLYRAVLEGDLERMPVLHAEIDPPGWFLKEADWLRDPPRVDANGDIVGGAGLRLTWATQQGYVASNLLAGQESWDKLLRYQLGLQPYLDEDYFTGTVENLVGAINKPTVDYDCAARCFNSHDAGGNSRTGFGYVQEALFAQLIRDGIPPPRAQELVRVFAGGAWTRDELIGALQRELDLSRDRVAKVLAEQGVERLQDAMDAFAKEYMAQTDRHLLAGTDWEPITWKRIWEQYRPGDGPATRLGTWDDALAVLDGMVRQPHLEAIVNDLGGDAGLVDRLQAAAARAQRRGDALRAQLALLPGTFFYFDQAGGIDRGIFPLFSGEQTPSRAIFGGRVQEFKMPSPGADDITLDVPHWAETLERAMNLWGEGFSADDPHNLLVRDLIAGRLTQGSILAPDARPHAVEIGEPDPSLGGRRTAFATRVQGGNGEPLMVVTNLGGAETVDLDVPTEPGEGRWKILFDSSDARYGQERHGPRRAGGPAVVLEDGRVRVPRDATIALVQETSAAQPFHEVDIPAAIQQRQQQRQPADLAAAGDLQEQRTRYLAAHNPAGC